MSAGSSTSFGGTANVARMPTVGCSPDCYGVRASARAGAATVVTGGVPPPVTGADLGAASPPVVYTTATAGTLPT